MGTKIIGLLSLKNNKKKQKKLGKHSSWRGIMKAMREVSGANGKGGDPTQTTHMRRRTGVKGKYLFRSFAKRVQKKAKKSSVEAAGWHKKKRRG